MELQNVRDGANFRGSRPPGQSLLPPVRHALPRAGRLDEVYDARWLRDARLVRDAPALRRGGSAASRNGPECWAVNEVQMSMSVIEFNFLPRVVIQIETAIYLLSVLGTYEYSGKDA